MVGRGLKPIKRVEDIEQLEASPGRMVGRGLKHIHADTHMQDLPGIARPNGRARIETSYCIFSQH